MQSEEIKITIFIGIRGQILKGKLWNKFFQKYINSIYGIKFPKFDIIKLQC